jgi:hypothetical protein
MFKKWYCNLGHDRYVVVVFGFIVAVYQPQCSVACSHGQRKLAFPFSKW